MEFAKPVTNLSTIQLIVSTPALLALMWLKRLAQNVQLNVPFALMKLPAQSALKDTILIVINAQQLVHLDYLKTMH